MMSAICNLKYYPAISDLIIDLIINNKKDLTNIRFKRLSNINSSINHRKSEAELALKLYNISSLPK